MRTEGPWKIRQYQSGGGIGWAIDAPDARRLGVASDITLHDDARLIADAPELLALLKLIADSSVFFSDNGFLVPKTAVDLAKSFALKHAA